MRDRAAVERQGVVRLHSRCGTQSAGRLTGLDIFFLSFKDFCKIHLL